MQIQMQMAGMKIGFTVFHKIYSFIANSIESHLQSIQDFQTSIPIDFQFLSDPGVPGVRSMGPVLCHRRFWNLTDVDGDIK